MNEKKTIILFSVFLFITLVLFGIIIYYREELANYRNIEFDYSERERENQARYERIESENNELGRIIRGLRVDLEQSQLKLADSRKELNDIRDINKRTEQQLSNIESGTDSITEAVRNIREQVVILETHFNRVRDTITD